MKTKRILLTIVAVLGLASAANADLFYGFNTDAEGFQNVAWQATSPVGWPGASTVQQTHTAGGWQMMMTKEFSWEAGGGVAGQQTEMQALAALGNDAHLSFDAMVDSTSFPAGTATWFQFLVVGNSDGAAGWTQSQLLDSWQNAGQADLRTWHFDLAIGQLGWQPGDTWFQLWTGCNSDGAAPVNFYLDNVRVYVVPEPGILALAGLGAAAFLIARRK